MTKMQIIAKAVLTFLGIGAIVNLSIGTLIFQGQDVSITQVVLSSSVVIILLIATAYFFIFKNDWLVYKMAGPGEKPNPESEILWLAASLRMVAILYGLMMLSTSMPTILNIIVSPLHIRSLVNEIFMFRAFPKSLTFKPYQWSYMTFNFLRAILAVYLLYGWPQFIRFQLNLRKSEALLDRNHNAKGVENE
jgi:hypothetical protein